MQTIKWIGQNIVRKKKKKSHTKKDDFNCLKISLLDNDTPGLHLSFSFWETNSPDNSNVETKKQFHILVHARMKVIQEKHIADEKYLIKT